MRSLGEKRELEMSMRHLARDVEINFCSRPVCIGSVLCTRSQHSSKDNNVNDKTCFLSQLLKQFCITTCIILFIVNSATLWKKKAKLESPLPLEILAVGGATEVWIFSETTQYRIHVCQKVDFWSDLHEICGCHGKITIMDTQ